MNEIIGLTADKLSGWDFLIAGLIVVFVEYVVKLIVKNASDTVQNVVYKVAPIVLGAAVYVVLAIIQGSAWYSSLIHGVFVGLTSMGSYDVILKAMKTSGAKSISDTNTAVEEAIKGDK